MATQSFAQVKAINSLANDDDVESIANSDFVPADDGGLGSTMTLEQLGGKRGKPPAVSTVRNEEDRPLVVELAAEPSPALKYRLWPRERELKPGSAQLFYMRALLNYRSLTDEQRLKIDQDWFMEKPIPGVQARHQLVESLGNIYDELHTMAMCEDFEFDHRWRTLTGVEVYAFMLAEVQEARALARLLRLKVDDHLARREFAEAIQTAGDGYRLAHLMAQGEALVQQLVGVAIAGMMLECITDAIETPGCPNLYWAIASLPKPLSNMRRSLDIEMSALPSLFPALKEAEFGEHDEKYWMEQWKGIVEGVQNLGDGSLDEGLAMAVAPVTFAPAARKRLLAGGYDQSALEKMPDMRVVLLDALYELRRVGDEYEKTSLLPYAVSRKLIARENRELDEWREENKLTSAAGALASIAFPFARVAREAEVRSVYAHHRFMTIEAIRMHAQDHGLPASLDEIEVVPPMLNSFNGKAFQYERQSDDTFVLRGELPKRFEHMKEITVRVVK